MKRLKTFRTLFGAILLASTHISSLTIDAFTLTPETQARRIPFLSKSFLQSSPESKLTDYLIENLEGGNNGSITKVSTTRAGENDILPEDGLLIGNFRILPAGLVATADKLETDELNEDGEVVYPIRLLEGRNGWGGTGVHPTTRLCIEWLCRKEIIMGGESLLDYGTGSGILSIAALQLGAASAIGVDIEAEALVRSSRNVDLNG